MIKGSLIALVCICIISTIGHSQTTQQLSRPLVLITAEKHQAIKSLDELNQIIKDIPNLKAITLNADETKIVYNQLKQLGEDLSIVKQQVSSLQVMNSQLKNTIKAVFEQTTSVNDVKKALETTGKNVLLYLNWTPKQQRVLSQEPEQLIQTPTEETESRSQLFDNMSPVGLTGLLVSLFLVIMLLIAIKCLYEVKTNDQFGRTNLWVGKES